MLARILKKSGYATGHFGKWHMGGQRDVNEAPPISAYGFDESLTNFEGMGAKLLPLTEMRGEDGKIIKGRIWDKAEILGEPVTWMLCSKITGGFVKSIVFAIIVSTICCFQGYFTHMRKDSYGAKAVGLSTTSAVVLSCVLILVGDFVVTSFLL